MIIHLKEIILLSLEILLIQFSVKLNLKIFLEMLLLGVNGWIKLFWNSYFVLRMSDIRSSWPDFSLAKRIKFARIEPCF